MGKRVNELAKEIDKKPSEVLRKLEQMGIESNVNTVLTDEQVQMIYDIYRIKNPATGNKVRATVITSSDAASPVKTVIVKAPVKPKTKPSIKTKVINRWLLL